ncbi:FHY3/FAR1 family protein [Dioscorea alata]|uniref:FHY3/FAR1 family protein n=1 Tax=Dioscorea alata TaxID=55571 RepID=A0ACB7VQC6_DIOAL|nr:FHY3/FAR1 family protein [Dioscorea alata]
MILDSEEEVYKLYVQYARCEGFGITKKSTRLDDDGKLKYYTLACVRGGKRISTSKNSFNPRLSTKVNCLAKINVIVGSDGRFTISSVNLEHNHALIPQKALFQKNFIAKARQFRLGVGDAVALGKYFSRMQQRNTKFFHLIDMDEEGRLRNVFWADARYIAAYEAFGDVISFDTTYLMNKYDMPFAPFVGVNHHGQTVLFGCGLLSKEDTGTYVCLFKTWLECMSGKAPNAIITDQCMTIQDFQVPEKLGGFNEYKAIKKILKRITYEAVDPQEFEDTYLKMMADYNIEKNEWLNSLFKICDIRWAPVYVRDIFWAGMSTTQRSESVNSFFDGYVGPTTSLKQFVEQYDHALKSKIEKENKADFASFNSRFPLITDCYFEKQLQEAYTNKIFKLFQDELQGMIYCNLTLTGSHGAVCSFQQVVYNVYTNVEEFDIKCSCRLFKFKGIICRHICKVLIEKNVQDIPSRYILPRWRKDIKRMHTYVQNCYDDPQTS